MIPRWVLVVGGILATVWLINDPAGMGQFLNHAGDSVKTFFHNLG